MSQYRGHLGGGEFEFSVMKSLSQADKAMATAGGLGLGTMIAETLPSSIHASPEILLAAFIAFSASAIYKVLQSDQGAVK